jgi:hypothetical protein
VIPQRLETRQAREAGERAGHPRDDILAGAGKARR